MQGVPSRGERLLSRRRAEDVRVRKVVVPIGTGSKRKKAKRRWPGVRWNPASAAS